MAEGGSSNKVPGKLFEDSILEVGEEEASKCVCGPCQEDGLSLQVFGYCVDCDEYLCENCFNCHRIPKPMRRHVLQTREPMPMKSNEREGKTTGTFKCQLHPDQALTHYCKSHDLVCCERCFLIGHGICKEVVKVDEVAGNVEETEEFKEFNKKIVDSVEGYTINKETAERKMKFAEDNYARVLERFRTKIERIKERNLVKLKGIVDTCEMTIDEIERWRKQKIKLQSDSNKIDLFILTKLTQKQFCLNDNSIVDMTKGNKVETYGFRSIDNEDGVIGRLIVGPCLVKKLICRDKSETSICSIRDMLFIGNNLLLLSDRQNDTIKLMNTDTDTVTAVYKVKHGAWNMCLTDDKQVFMTQPESKSILHLRRPTEDLSDIKEIAFNNRCYAIEFQDQKLRITCTDPPKIVETGLDGKILRTVLPDLSKPKDATGQSFIVTPEFSVLNTINGHCYYSCTSQHAVSEISKDGKVRLILKSSKLNEPRGMALEDDATLLVGSYGAKMVFRLTTKGDISEALATPLPFTPWCIEFARNSRELYVGGEGDQVYVYQL